MPLDELVQASSAGDELSTVPPGSESDNASKDDKSQDDASKSANIQKEYSMEEVAKHNTENDCWVVVNGQVLDVTGFLDDHPGGKMAIVTFAGKDASEEFNMLHEKTVIEKYAPEVVIGTLKPSSKL